MPFHRTSVLLSTVLLGAFSAVAFGQLPHATPNGFDLANGWRITPAGKAVGTEDMVLKLVTAPDGTIAVGSNPNDMKLSPDARLFVACSNDNDCGPRLAQQILAEDRHLHH